MIKTLFKVTALICLPILFWVFIIYYLFKAEDKPTPPIFAPYFQQDS